MLDAPRKLVGGRGLRSTHTPALASVSTGHRTRRSWTVAPPTRSALAARGTWPSALSSITPPSRVFGRKSRARSELSRMSRLLTLLFRRSLLRRLLFTTSLLSTLITAYEVPPSAMNSAAVAAIFEYDRCFRSELCTTRYLGRGRRILAGALTRQRESAAVRRPLPPPLRRANCH